LEQQWGVRRRIMSEHDVRMFDPACARYRRWLLTILCWDSMLPVFVAVAPLGVRLAFPNSRGAIEITAVALPVAAFVARLVAGRRHIASNRCHPALRTFQYAAFLVAIVLLGLIDCVLILAHLMPRGELFAAREDRVVWCVLVSVYLLTMAFALFPGAAAEDSENSDHTILRLP
jgi:hypothetical protein